MGQIEAIRKSIFGATQAEFALIAGTTQATVSRWENGEGGPGLDELSRIRAEARQRGLDWSDAWFFETVPEGSPEIHQQ